MRTLKEADVRHNVAVNTAHGGWQSLSTSLYNPFLGVMALSLGASTLQVALLSALPAAVALIGSLLGAAALRRVSSNKRAASVTTLASRLLLLAIAAVPALLAPGKQASAFVFLVALMGVPGAISAIAWQSLLADAIPDERRADALAVRSRAITAVAFLPTLVGGYVLDALSFPIGYQLVLAAAFLSSVVEVRVLMKMREPASVCICAPQGVAGPSDASSGREAAGRARPPRSFVVFCLCTALFYVGWIMGAPLFTLYYVQVLKVGNLWVGAFNVISMVVQYIAFPWWSRLSRSRGSVLALGAATAGMALTPLLIAVSPSPWLIAMFCVSMGIFTSGTTMLLLDSLLDSVPEKGRTPAIAVYNVCVNLASFVGPLVGNAVVDGAGIYWALAACAVLRGAGAASIVGFARSVARPDSRDAQLRSARMASL